MKSSACATASQRAVGVVAATDRLTLRRFEPSDLDSLAAILGDPEVMRFSQGRLTRRATRDWIQRRAQSYQSDDFGLWAVQIDASGPLIGFCGLIRQIVDGEAEIEIGYRLASEHWGRGYATEAAAAVCRLAFGQLALRRVIAIIHAENVRSIRVAEKVGMRYEKDACVFRPDQSLRIYARHSEPQCE